MLFLAITFLLFYLLLLQQALVYFPALYIKPKFIIQPIYITMSRVITNTNIIVDDFNFCKSFPKDTFVHFLTHYHSDHYQGLSPLWNYGPIYCTHQTKEFINFNFPKITNIYSYDFNEEKEIQIRPNLFVKFCFFDAKHIPGSAMILFRGYMGSILFTGDFRYNYNMVKENLILFPLSRRNNEVKQQIVQSMSGISIPIDQMIFDNTYCNENFRFEKEGKIAQLMIEIIQKNKNKKLVYIAMGALGKHKILLQIAKYFQTLIVVSEKQFMKIKVAKLSTDFLTTSPDQGYIQLISKKNKKLIVEQTKESEIGNNFICIDTDFLMLEHQSPDQINYIVPYSLHSNYKEMETLIKLIKPCILRKLVIPYSNFRSVKLKIKVNHRLKFAKYLDYLENKLHKSQSGYSYLIRHYTEIYRLSQKFLEWFQPEKQESLRKVLKVGEQDHSLRKRKVHIDDDSSQSMSRKSKKQSLKSIADNLNAVNKNKTIERVLSEQSRMKLQKKCEQLYEQTIMTHTFSKESECEEDSQESIE